MSMFASLGAPSAGSYNCALGFFLLYSAYMRVGRINLHCLCLHLLSFVCDILALATRSDQWARQGSMAAFALALLILLLFIKCIALVMMTLIHGELGDSSLSLVGGFGANSGYSLAPQQGRLSRSASFGGHSAPPQQAAYAHPAAALPVAMPYGHVKHPSRSGSFSNLHTHTPGGSTRTLHGEAHEQQRGMSPAPASGSFRVASSVGIPALAPPPSVLASSYQIE